MEIQCLLCYCQHVSWETGKMQDLGNLAWTHTKLPVTYNIISVSLCISNLHLLWHATSTSLYILEYSIDATFPSCPTPFLFR